METFDLLIEVSKILRGEHPSWEGDSVWNAESYLRQFVNDFANAENTADDIERNISDCSDLSGLSPNRVQWVVNRIRDLIRFNAINSIKR